MQTVSMRRETFKLNKAISNPTLYNPTCSNLTLYNPTLQNPTLYNKVSNPDKIRHCQIRHSKIWHYPTECPIPDTLKSDTLKSVTPKSDTIQKSVQSQVRSDTPKDSCSLIAFLFQYSVGTERQSKPATTLQHHQAPKKSDQSKVGSVTLWLGDAGVERSPMLGDISLYMSIKLSMQKIEHHNHIL